MNLTEKLARRQVALQQFSSEKGTLHHFELEGPVGPRMRFEGREYLVWCLNDYLGLMNHPESIRAAAEVTAELGPSYPHSVRLTVGHTSSHDELEGTLSSLMRTDDAMLVNLGYPGFASIIDALTDRHDVILYDKKCHACLIDGVRLHNGQRLAFRHNDVEHLRSQLERARSILDEKLGMMLVIVDGLYSMHGELAPLDEIVRLKEEFGFTLLVDDSHAFGVFGENGRGSAEHFGVEEHVDVTVATFTKALGNLGGFVTARQSIIDYLRFSVRSQIFSRSMPLSMVKAVATNLAVLKREPERRTRLRRNTKRFQDGLRSLGIHIGETVSPITPIKIQGDYPTGRAVFRRLREEGVFSYIVAYPVVGKDECLIRMVVTYGHTDGDIDQTLDVMGRLKAEFPEALSIPGEALAPS